MFWHGVEVPSQTCQGIANKSSFLETLGVRFRNKPNNVSIAIVGGGLAGLIAAYEAKSLGFRVQVLEGRAHRTGGRIQTRTDFVPGVWAEAGPEFLSPAHTILLWYLKRFKLELLETEDMVHSPFTPILPDDRIDQTSIEIDSSLLKKALLEESKRLSKLSAEDMEKLDQDTLWEFIEDQNFPEISNRYFETHFEFENGVNPRKTGLLPYLSLVRCHKDGFFENLERYRIDGGLSQLIQNLESELIGKISKRSHVKRIVKERTFQIIQHVVTKDETSTYFHAVVVTVPPSLWNNGELFNLSLPSDLMPQMGNSIKVLIKVPKEVRIETGILPSSFLNQESLVQAIWESGMGTHPHHKIITVMCGGSAAERLSRMNQDDAIALILHEVSQYYPTIKLVSEKENFYFKAWGKKTLTRCGYGCPAPYELTDYRVELEGLLPEKLYLCGEWNSWEMWGYMEGAVRSALTAVLEICRKYDADIPYPLLSRMN